MTSQRAFRSFIGLAAVICLPAIGVPVLMTLTALPDISDVVPKVPHSDGYVLLDWSALERGRRTLKTDGLSTGTQVRALGYMMEADQPIRDGQLAMRFVLMPDAGNALLAAHRFGDQMIEVQMQPGNTVQFWARSLVWVWGVLRVLPGNPLGPKPLYQLVDARSESADKADIPRYFR